MIPTNMISTTHPQFAVTISTQTRRNHRQGLPNKILAYKPINDRDPSDRSGPSSTGGEDHQEPSKSKTRPKKKNRYDQTSDTDGSDNTASTASTATRLRRKRHLTYKPKSLGDERVLKLAMRTYRKALDFCN